MNNIELKIRLARSYIEDGTISFWDYYFGSIKDRVAMLAEKYPWVVIDEVWAIANREIDDATCKKLMNDIGYAVAVHQASSLQMMHDFSVAQLTPQKIKDFKDAAIRRIGLDQVNNAIRILREGSLAEKEAVIADYNFAKVRWNDGSLGSIQVTDDVELGWETFEPYGMSGLTSDGDLL